MNQEPGTGDQAPPPTFVIQPTRGWGVIGLGELWHYRDLLWFQVMRDVKGKYRQMALGPLWIILQPIINMVLFSLIFGKLAKLPTDGNLPYPIFIYVAMVPWSYFSTSCGTACGSLAGQMHIISKVYFPRLVVPLSAVISGLVDFLMQFLVLVVLMLCFGYIPSWRIVFLPLYLLFAAGTSLGIGLWSAALTVRFRDLNFLMSTILRIWMYATPVVYSSSLVAQNGSGIMWLYQLNPMYWVIEGFRWSLVGTGQSPQLYMLIPVGIVAVLLYTGAHVFRRTERTIVDLL